MHQSQIKFLTNDKDKPRRSFNYLMMINLLTPNFNHGVKSSKNADHLSSWAPLRWVHNSKQCFCKYVNLCMGMFQQKLQAGLDIHEGLTAQKYIDEMVKPHFSHTLITMRWQIALSLCGAGRNFIQQG